MQIRDQKAISIFISTSVIDYDKQLIYTHIYIYLTSDLTAALLEYWTVYRTVSKVTKSTSFILLCRRSILLSKKNEALYRPRRRTKMVSSFFLVDRSFSFFSPISIYQKPLLFSNQAIIFRETNLFDAGQTRALDS